MGRYGFFGQTIGLRVEADGLLWDARDEVLNDMNNLLKMWNLPEIQKIMASDPQSAMYLSGKFEPHISIATIKRPEELPPLDRFDVGELELQLGAGHF